MLGGNPRGGNNEMSPEGPEGPDDEVSSGGGLLSVRKKLDIQTRNNGA